MNHIAIKKILLLALAAAPTISFAQDAKYTIQGKIGDNNAPAKVYLEYRKQGKTIIDSVALNGAATFP